MGMTATREDMGTTATREDMGTTAACGDMTTTTTCEEPPTTNIDEDIFSIEEDFEDMMDRAYPLKEMADTCFESLQLNEMFHEILVKTAIDHETEEMKDIREAIYTMLQRAKQRVNECTSFQIVRIEPCGSMTEKTSAWKYDFQRKETYTEFDFIAVLGNSLTISNGCETCVRVEGFSVEKTIERETSDKSDQYTDTYSLDNAFKDILRSELIFSFPCLSEMTKIVYGSTPGYSMDNYFPEQHVCDRCTVDMPTGTLRVNIFNHYQIMRGMSVSLNCSLSFLWESKAQSMTAFNWLSRETRKINRFLIYVDFLPALEIPEHKSAGKQHDCKRIAVSKTCAICCESNSWRKSFYAVEKEIIVKHMSEKHKNCYKVLKQLCQLMTKFGNLYKSFSPFSPHFSLYFVKIIALNHSRSCSANSESEDYSECVLKMFIEFIKTHEFEQLEPFYLSSNIFSVAASVSYHPRLARRMIFKLKSVKDTDTWEDFVEKLIKN